VLVEVRKQTCELLCNKVALGEGVEEGAHRLQLKHSVIQDSIDLNCQVDVFIRTLEVSKFEEGIFYLGVENGGQEVGAG